MAGVAANGCVGPFRNPFASAGPPAPQVLRPGASLDEVIAAVNANSSRVHTYAANGAAIWMAGVPTLSGSILIERPHRLRIRAGTALTGPEIDMGGNEQLLWMWVRQSEPPAVHLCRREQFASSQARQLMPIEPDWLPAALGLVEFGPLEQYQPPRIGPDRNIEIISTITGPTGPLSKLTVVDATRAWVLQQHVYDSRGTLLASALASEHRYFPEHHVSLPQRVEVRLPLASLTLVIQPGQIHLNSALGDPGHLWAPPQIEGYPHVDIGGGTAVGGGTSAASGLPTDGQIRAITRGAQPVSGEVRTPLPRNDEPGWHPVHRLSTP
jgi:hypothetical protein